MSFPNSSSFIYLDTSYFTSNRSFKCTCALCLALFLELNIDNKQQEQKNQKVVFRIFYLKQCNYLRKIMIVKLFYKHLLGATPFLAVSERCYN